MCSQVHQPPNLGPWAGGTGPNNHNSSLPEDSSNPSALPRLRAHGQEGEVALADMSRASTQPYPRRLGSIPNLSTTPTAERENRHSAYSDLVSFVVAQLPYLTLPV